MGTEGGKKVNQQTLSTDTQSIICVFVDVGGRGSY